METKQTGFPGKMKDDLTQWLRQGILSGKASGVLRGVTDILYYPAFAFCFGWLFIGDSTMYYKAMSDAFEKRMDGYYDIAVFIVLLCAVAGMLLQNSISLAVFEALLLITSYINYKAGGHKYSYYVLAVLIVGATGRSFRKILAIAFSLGTLSMAAAYIGTRVGIIEDLVYIGGRHSYGIVYCTDCTAHILFLMLTYALLRWVSFHYVDYLVLLFGLFYMRGTGGKTDMICAVLLIGGIVFARLWDRLSVHPACSPVFRVLSGRAASRIGRAAAGAGSFSFLICAAFSFAATLKLSTESPIIKALGHTVEMRLVLGLRALQEHPVTFFGTKLKENSFGGRTTNLPSWDDYFFIDCSYVRLYVIGGVIVFAMFLIVLTCAEIRCFLAKQYMYQYILLLAALVCVMEHHLVDFSFNVFPLMAFTNSRFFGEKPLKRTWSSPPEDSLPFDSSAQEEESDTGEIQQAGKSSAEGDLEIMRESCITDPGKPGNEQES